jgi:hypothetical protein
MPYQFNEDKYKKIFDQMYGNGSFDSGIDKARKIGQSKANADFAKQQYDERIKQQKAEIKKQEKAAKTKTYDDAVNYWSDPKTKKDLLGRGVEKTENDILNDPRYKAQIKAAGFNNLSDFIDAMYNAVSNGSALSKRQFKQNEQTQNFNVDPKPGPLEHIGAPQLDYNANLTNKPTPLVPYVQEQPKAKKKPKAQNESLLEHLKDFFLSKDTNHDGKADGLAHVMDILNRPENAVLTGIKEQVNGGSFLHGVKDGWSGEQQTSGKDLNKQLGFDPNHNALSQIGANLLGKAVLKKLPLGEVISPWVNKSLTNKIGGRKQQEQQLKQHLILLILLELEEAKHLLRGLESLQLIQWKNYFLSLKKQHKNYLNFLKLITKSKHLYLVNPMLEM